MKIDKVVLLALAIFAIIVIGEVCTVNKDIHNYDSSAEWRPGSVEFSVYASGSEVYDAILTDNHGYVSTEHLTIYVDDDYNKNYTEANNILKTSYVDQNYAYHELSVALGNRHFSDVTKCNDAGLLTVINDTMNKKGYGILINSYELPETVYDGTANCPLIKWVNNGGNLYWFGSEIGAFVKTSEGIMNITNNQELFFGVSGCINREDNTGVKDTNETTKYFSFRNSYLLHGIDVSKIKDRETFTTGYMNNGYSTIGMVSMGKGSICIFSQSNTMYMFDDISQIIASKINPYTDVVSHTSGTVTRGTVKDRMDVNVEDHHLYVYIGGYYTVYGRVY